MFISFPRLRATAMSLLIAAVVSACATKTPAPVTDRRPAPSATPATPAAPATTAAKPATPEAKPADTGKTHTVQKGETLIGIALQYGLDYRELAIWNNIENPNVIKLNSILRVTPPGADIKEPKPGAAVATPLVTTPMPSAASERPPTNTTTSKAEPRGGKLPYTDQAYDRLSKAAPVPAAPVATTPTVVGSTTGAAPATTATPPITAATPPVAPAAAATDDVEWSWPVKGKVVANFTDANKGLDIAGTKGTPVLAAAPGKIVYANSGLRGYGRLVIIKHNNTWLSAYAHNDKILVTEGQEVKRGQKIAEMGNSDADQVKLHFEVRKQGKPLDPAKFLPAQ